MRKTQVWSLSWEDPLEEDMATHFSILAWRIPWTEEPGGLQSMGLQRVQHDWATTKITQLLFFFYLILKQISNILSFPACVLLILFTVCFILLECELDEGSDFIYFLIEGWLLYRILLFSVKPQHESAIGIHVSPPSWTSLPSPSPSHPSRLMQSPCLNQF